MVIVGGGFGGLTCARALGSASCDLVLIDRRNHHLFQPLLYQVATAGLSPADIAIPIRSVLHHYPRQQTVLAEVTGVDRASREVVTASGRRYGYDILVLATGASHSYFSHPEWASLAPGLKTVQDAVTIRAKVLLAFEAAETEADEARRKALLSFVVVGGGPTGVEIAGSIAELARYALASDFRRIDPKSARIILLEASPRILAAFPEKLSVAARRKLESLGVEVRNGGRVDAIDRDGVMIAGERIPASTVLWAAGVGASPAGKWLDAAVDPQGRVRVEADLTAPGHPEIFVIGDTARVGEKGLPGVAPVAIQQGKFVAAVIRERIAGASSARPFHYKDKGNLATVGRSFAVAEIGRFRFAGIFAWIVWVFVHIYFLIGYRNRLVVLTEWAWAWLTFQRGSRLITEGSAVTSSNIGQD